MGEKIVLSSKRPKVARILHGLLLLIFIVITVVLSWNLSVSQMTKLLENSNWSNMGFEYTVSFSKVILLFIIYLIAILVIFVITALYSKIKTLDRHTIGLKRTYSTFLLIILMSILIPLVLGIRIGNERAIHFGNSYDVVLTQLVNFNNFSMGLDLFIPNLNIQNYTINFLLKNINFFTIIGFIYLANRLKVLGVTSKSYIWIQVFTFALIVWILSHINILKFATWVE